ncbi:MAG: repressor LexA [Chloroflexi bacterium]|nr:MAG: repressor LexA [Chloroflexota bacterium]
MKEHKPLSPRQQRILEFVHKYIRENGRPPTIREIGQAADIPSTSVVNYNLGKLEQYGLIERESEVSRGLRLTERAYELLGVAVDAVNGVIDRLAGASRVIRLPLAGDIVASEPIEVGSDGFSTYDELDMIEVTAAMLQPHRGDLYALRVHGDSMIDAMVNDGDIVIMEKVDTARDGEMVAVWLVGDDQTTLKYLFRENDRVRLQPANPTMEPIYVPAEKVKVQGKVLAVLRQLA